jgi:ABC-2 type transport system ATP-binding protein
MSFCRSSCDFLWANMKRAFLEVRDLRHRYGSIVALDGVRFEVQAGEMFGLLGPNGAGKTTLMSILSCLLAPGAGEANLEGCRLTPENRAPRPLIGIVPQELALYLDLSARENLYFFGSLYGMPNDRLTERMETVLAAIGLSDRANERVGAFSGGMQRRLNLGIGLIHEPKLLLLDEPTTGVDPQSRNHIFEEIRRVNRAGMTVIYTSHYMEEVEALCSRIAVIDHGRIIACDTLPGLLRQMDGLLRCRFAEVSAELRTRLGQIPGVKLLEEDGGLLTVRCQDAKAVLLRVLSLINETRSELIGLEMEEPNLERVFLHLTGRALRD